MSSMLLPSNPEEEKQENLRNDASIRSLPVELLVDVLARVASSSFIDLVNSKLCCRGFMGAAEDNYILQHVSIENFPVIQWFKCDEVDSFLNRCKENGNPEALYRQGMVEYFSYVRMEAGLEQLKRAADKGHLEASYVYGIILLCMGGESSIQGMKLLNATKRTSKSNSMRILQECRERIKTILRTMWVNNHLVRRETGFCCHAQTRPIEVESWEGRQYIEDEMGCEACRWDREVTLFCDMLH